VPRDNLIIPERKKTRSHQLARANPGSLALFNWFGIQASLETVESLL
jgi:hypothetical protein